MNLAADSSVCLECGYSHAPDVRRASIRLAVLSGAPSADIREAWPCWYPDGDAGARMLARDSADVREAATPAERKALDLVLWARLTKAQRDLDEIRRRHRDEQRRQ